MWGDNVGVVLEGSYVEATCHKCTTDKGGGNWIGVTSHLCGVLPSGSDDGEIPGDGLSGNSA